MNCPQCGHPNLAGAAFCDNCGFDLNQAPPAPAQPVYAPPVAPTAPAYAPPPAAMPTAPAMGGGGAVCSQCGTPAQAGAGFCDNCGAPLAGSAAPAPIWQPPAQPAYQAPVQPPYQPVPQAAPGVGGTCPNCQMPVMPGAGFCDNCGAALGAAPAQPPLPAWQQPIQPQVQPIGAMRMLLVVATSGAQIPLAGKQEFLIGREDPIGNVFPDADLGPHGGDTGGVSRQHAKILVRGNQVLVEDLNSTNGTWVNKVKVQPGQPAPVADGSEIRLGKVALIFQMS